MRRVVNILRDLAIGPTIQALHFTEKLVMDPTLIWTGLDQALNWTHWMNQKEVMVLHSIDSVVGMTFQMQILQEELVLCLILMGLDHHPSWNYQGH